MYVRMTDVHLASKRFDPSWISVEDPTLEMILVNWYIILHLLLRYGVGSSCCDTRQNDLVWGEGRRGIVLLYLPHSDKSKRKIHVKADGTCNGSIEDFFHTRIGFFLKTSDAVFT